METTANLNNNHSKFIKVVASSCKIIVNIENRQYFPLTQINKELHNLTKESRMSCFQKKEKKKRLMLCLECFKFQFIKLTMGFTYMSEILGAAS